MCENGKNSNSNEKILERLQGKYSQSFTSLVPTFILDSKSDCLVETGYKDIQKEIDSHQDCALDNMLEKFLDPIQNSNIQYVDGITEVANIDLIDLADMSNDKEELAVKYGLNKDASLNDIYEAIKKVLTKKSEEVIDDEKAIK